MKSRSPSVIGSAGHFSLRGNAAFELPITLNPSPRLDLRARGDSDTLTNAGEMAYPSVPLDGCSAIDPGVESNENMTGCVVRIFFCPLAFLYAIDAYSCRAHHRGAMGKNCIFA